MNLPHLAQRLFNTPLALHPSKAEVIMASVMDRFGITKIESSLAMDDDWYSFDDNGGNHVTTPDMRMCWVLRLFPFTERWFRS